MHAMARHGMTSVVFTDDIARVAHPEVRPWLQAGSRHRCRELLPSLVDESRAVHCLDGEAKEKS